MSMKKLVEAECGGANALVGLSSHFIQDRALKDEGFHSFTHSDAIASANADQLAHEFLEETSPSTQPFRMESLLAEMRELEGRAGPVISPPVSQLTTEGEWAKEWAQQYLNSGKHFQVRTDPEIWTSELEGEEPSSSLGFGPKWADEYLQRTQDQILDDTPTLADLSNSEEYEEKADPLAEAAGEVLSNTANDPRFTFSKFMRFMKEINDGEVTIDKEGNVRSMDDSGDNTSRAEHWSLDYEQEQEPSSKWAEEFLETEAQEALLSEDADEPFNKQLWEKLTEQWKNFSSSVSESAQWASGFNEFSTGFKEYTFAKDNPMKSIPNPLEEGKKMIQVGDLPSAVLCFEAAVQQEPDNPLAWQLLGTTQAENEQDPAAIAALTRCIQIQPDNLSALMALSASYTNENYQNQACLTLKEWLRMNPKYADLVPKDADKPTIPSVSSFLAREVYNEVKDTFLKAARRNPQDLDPDIQCGLGVLFNISSETDLAADCFKAALQVRPTDAALWNRLGATLANGDRSEEAVDAYRSALHLQPGFIRARYNLGITCVHLGAYREAAEHLLTALKQQSVGRGPQGETTSNMSDTIWTTLRLVMSLLERMDLMNDVYQRNLKKLTEEFGID